MQKANAQMVYVLIPNFLSISFSDTPIQSLNIILLHQKLIFVLICSHIIIIYLKNHCTELYK